MDTTFTYPVSDSSTVFPGTCLKCVYGGKGRHATGCEALADQVLAGARVYLGKESPREDDIAVDMAKPRRYRAKVPVSIDSNSHTKSYYRGGIELFPGETGVD
jgi:hypothetical protein